MLGLKLSPTGLINWRQAGDPYPDLPANFLAQAPADFDSAAEWTEGGLWSIAGGIATKPVHTAASNLDFDSLGLPAGTYWIQADVIRSNGSTAGFRVRLLQGAGGTIDYFLSVDDVQTYAHLITVAGHNRLRLTGQAAWEGDVDNIRIFDMAAIQALPVDIYGVLGQSNAVGLHAEEEGFFPESAPHPYITCIPGSTWGNGGMTQGVESAAYDPLQHYNGSGNNRGQGPGMSFARRMLARGDGTRRIMLVCFADNETTLTFTDQEWNSPNGPNAVAAIAALNAAKVGLPAGSDVKGILWSQGESDDGPNVAALYPPAFSALVAQIRSEVGPADLPFVILGPNPEWQASQGLNLATTQEKLDQDSGDATAVTGVRYVASPAGYQSITSHFTGPGQRLRGSAGADAMHALINQPAQTAPGAFGPGFGEGFG